MTLFKNEVVIFLNVHFLSLFYNNWKFPFVVDQNWVIICDYQTFFKSDHLDLIFNFSGQNTFDFRESQMSFYNVSFNELTYFLNSLICGC